MEAKQLAQIEEQIKEICGHMANLAGPQDFDELIQIIHRPGFTTVAEGAFLAGIVDSMHAHTKTMMGLKHALLTGCRAVTTK
jgi:hypothetical protein